MDLTSFAAPVEALKKGAEGTDDFHGKHDHIDEQDTEKHHHGVFLHLLRTFGGFLFQVVLLYLAHIKDQHLKIHLLVIAPQVPMSPLTISDSMVLPIRFWKWSSAFS